MKEYMEEQQKADEQILGIVAQHFNRALYQYDISTCTTRRCSVLEGEKDILGHLYSTDYRDSMVENNLGVLPDSIDTVKEFFAGIHAGIPSGERNIHIRLEDGQFRWYHFKYSCIFQEGQPVSALISAEDITERHEYELAYLHREQAVVKNVENYPLYMESCLTTDRVEKVSGQLLTEEEKQQKYTHGEFIRLLIREKFRLEDDTEPVQYLDREYLLKLYEMDERQIVREFRVRFHDGTVHWMHLSITMIADPFDGKIKLFTQLGDITEQKNENLSLRQKADYDDMTGLLRRDVGEARVREYLAAHSSPGGILIILDLDDLKGINDTLGHIYGDKAIASIGGILIKHFRKDDVLVRIGGDEFLVFLPGAGTSVGAIELSLESLLYRLSSVCLGDNGERTIHCSIGCAVELPETDTFDSLFQRADMALYHVKRNGKNNFAFFAPEMLESNYRFRANHMAPVIQKLVDETELKHLLLVMAIQYPGIVSFNLTRNYFRVLSIGGNTEDFPMPGRIEEFPENWKADVYADDRENILAALSRTDLLACYTRGQRRMLYYYRRREKDGFVRTEVDVRLYTAENGDICAFLFFREDND